jgi:hypothetical protein
LAHSGQICEAEVISEVSLNLEVIEKTLEVSRMSELWKSRLDLVKEANERRMRSIETSMIEIREGGEIIMRKEELGSLARINFRSDRLA